MFSIFCLELEPVHESQKTSKVTKNGDEELSISFSLALEHFLLVTSFFFFLLFVVICLLHCCYLEIFPFLFIFFSLKQGVWDCGDSLTYHLTYWQYLFLFWLWDACVILYKLSVVLDLANPFYFQYMRMIHVMVPSAVWA